MDREIARRKLLVCTGSHCRKALDKSVRLQEAVVQLPVDVAYVGCQKVCNGPVVGLSIAGKWEWFGEMGSKKAVGALAELLERGTLTRRLRKRRDRKRSGKRRT